MRGRGTPASVGRAPHWLHCTAVLRGAGVVGCCGSVAECARLRGGDWAVLSGRVHSHARLSHTQRLEVNEVVRKLEENRMYTSRDVAPRKVRARVWAVRLSWWRGFAANPCPGLGMTVSQAWGSAKPSEDSWRRWTGAPRSGTGVVGATQRRGDDQGATMRSTARSAVSYGTQGYAARPAPPPAHRAPVPDFGAVTDNWASSAPAGGAPPAAESAQYIRTLEAKVAELSETVDTLRKSQELPTGVAAGASVATAVPEQFAGQVEVLKEVSSARERAPRPWPSALPPHWLTHPVCCGFSGTVTTWGG